MIDYNQSSVTFASSIFRNIFFSPFISNASYKEMKFKADSLGFSRFVVNKSEIFFMKQS